MSWCQAYGYPDGSGEKFMTESDLRRFMLQGKLPKNWKKQTFTLEDVGNTMMALEGHNIPFGDEYARALKQRFPLSEFLPEIATEWRYMTNYAATQRGLGFFEDNIVNPMPGPSALVV
eukprot:symbB.v1.2.026804.t1/scaffold2702.1/size74278/5